MNTIKRNLLVELNNKLQWKYLNEDEKDKPYTVSSTRDDKGKYIYLVESKQQKYRVVAKVSDTVRLVDALKPNTEEPIVVKIFIDASGSDWKVGMSIMNQLLEEITRSQNRLFLGYCNLITAEKASLIGTAKPLFPVYTRHFILTDLMNHLGYWNDQEMLDEWIVEKFAGEEIHKDEIRILKEIIDKEIDLPKIRKEKIGEYKNPW